MRGMGMGHVLPTFPQSPEATKHFKARGDTTGFVSGKTPLARAPGWERKGGCCWCGAWSLQRLSPVSRVPSITCPQCHLSLTSSVPGITCPQSHLPLASPVPDLTCPWCHLSPMSPVPSVTCPQRCHRATSCTLGRTSGGGGSGGGGPLGGKTTRPRRCHRPSPVGQFLRTSVLEGDLGGRKVGAV